ncbi:MAG: ribonuclease III [Hyphomonadaceae bacterium]|nr:ribonuclease III [Hyphomonadaceae bacterium]
MKKSGASSNDARLETLERRLGRAFANRALLEEALTHASALEGKRQQRRSYDRLEFLGDRVLGLIVAQRIYEDHADEDEGALAPRLNALVNRQACARAARAAGLGEAALLSPSEEAQGGRGKEAILADLCEAVIGALYLDGGMEAASAFVEQFWGDAFDAGATRDAKTALQEWAAARKRALRYEVVETVGPEHALRFVVAAHVDGFAPTHGEGSSKREAQRAAAAAFMKENGVDG